MSQNLKILIVDDDPMMGYGNHSCKKQPQGIFII